MNRDIMLAVDAKAEPEAIERALTTGVLGDESVKHTGFSDAQPEVDFASVAYAWSSILGALRAYLETGIAKPALGRGAGDHVDPRPDLWVGQPGMRLWTVSTTGWPTSIPCSARSGTRVWPKVSNDCGES